MISVTRPFKYVTETGHLHYIGEGDHDWLPERAVKEGRAQKAIRENTASKKAASRRTKG